MKKYLVTHADGAGTFANAFALSDGRDRSFAAYRELCAAVMKVPGLTARVDSIGCNVVTGSRWCKGRPIVRFPVPDDFDHAAFDESWERCDGRLPDIDFG